MWKFEDIPALGKQDNDQLHAFQRWEIKHGQVQGEMNGAIWTLDPKNIILDTKIIILCALVQKLWLKMHFREMVENIMYP